MTQIFKEKKVSHTESKEMILESGMRWLMKLLASTLSSISAKQITLKLSNLKQQTNIISYFLWVKNQSMA